MNQKEKLKKWRKFGRKLKVGKIYMRLVIEEFYGYKIIQHN